MRVMRSLSLIDLLQIDVLMRFELFLLIGFLSGLIWLALALVCFERRMVSFVLCTGVGQFMECGQVETWLRFYSRDGLVAFVGSVLAGRPFSAEASIFSLPTPIHVECLGASRVGLFRVCHMFVRVDFFLIGISVSCLLAPLCSLCMASVAVRSGVPILG